MGRQSHVGYHNCRDDGGYEHLRSSVPFLSGDGDNQWLTQGYYFWTDSLYWAQKWNHGKKVAISEFSISFSHDEELLDLVGNTEQIFEFQRMRDKVAGQLHLKDVSKVTVSQVIAFLRKLERQPKTEGIFPYLAIKAQDNAKVGFFRRMSFIAGRREDLCLATRQQMCVFAHARDAIAFKGFVSPDEYKNR